MCGFIGIRRFDGAPIDLRHLSAVAELLAHRGPDGSGVWTAEGVGLAHRRLAIIDPSGSPQPMASADGTLHIAFNGEILNYRQLRKELRGPWRTNGDTEVLLELHRQKGTGALGGLRGQFAYALHDDLAGVTWLVRDRVGILPLFYTVQPGFIAFASEIKALLPFLDRVDVDRGQLDAYLRRRSVPAPGTLIRGVAKLPPGHVARIDHSGTMELSRYWSVADIPMRSVGDAEAIELVEAALSEAIDANLVADVPVGAYLSGGLDSSLVVALTAARGAVARLHTFSAGFGDARHDELPHARAVSDAVGTVHHEVVVRAAEFESHWRRLTWHRDAPLSEPADVAVNQLAVAASDHVKVVLSGEGADEVFGGYPKHRFATVTGLPLPAPLRWGFDRLERTVPPSMGRARMGLRALSAASPAERMEAWFAPFTRTERTRLLGSAAPEWSGVQPAEGVTSLRTMLEADCGAWLSDNLLERGDRMSMAASIELRPPFLDHRVIELGLSLPDRMKVRRGTGKWVLRELARSRLPSVIIDRPKVGFRVPLDRWFRDGMRSFAWDTLTAAGSFSSQVFDAAEVVRLLERHDRSRADESIRIWTLLGLEIWHQCTVASRRQAAAVGS